MELGLAKKNDPCGFKKVSRDDDVAREVTEAEHAVVTMIFQNDFCFLSLVLLLCLFLFLS